MVDYGFILFVSASVHSSLLETRMCSGVSAASTSSSSSIGGRYSDRGEALLGLVVNSHLTNEMMALIEPSYLSQQRSMACARLSGLAAFTEYV